MDTLVSVIDRIIDYSDSINMTKSIEHFDKGYREDVPLFNQECFNEALKNAFIHNNWLRRVSPMVTFYNDRVEIISFSKLAPRQTIEGFYKGNSIPVNERFIINIFSYSSKRKNRKRNATTCFNIWKEYF